MITPSWNGTRSILAALRSPSPDGRSERPMERGDAGGARVHEPIRPGYPKARRLSRRDTVLPMRGWVRAAGLSVGLASRRSHHSAVKLQRSLGAVDGLSCFSRSAKAGISEPRKADEHHHPSRGFRRGNFVDVSRAAPATRTAGATGPATIISSSTGAKCDRQKFSLSHGACPPGKPSALVPPCPPPAPMMINCGVKPVFVTVKN